MHLHELLGNIKPEAGPAELPRDRRIHLLKLPEDVFELVLRYTDAGIRDAIEQVVPLALHPNRNTSALAEFQRVSHQVHQTLRDSFSIPEGDRNIVWGGGGEPQPFSQAKRWKRGADGIPHVLHRIFGQRKLHATRLDFGKIEDIVDEAKEMLAVGLNIRQRLL